MSGMTPSQTAMAGVRHSIDELDNELVALLAKRQRLIETAAGIKRANGIPALVQERVDEVLGNVAAHARTQNLDGVLANALWTTIIDWSIAYEERLMKEAAEKDRA
jgi:isochorismate pyruvate lyase